MENGLSQSTVNCILQDSAGFMWFGTRDGLNKYDGYKFTVFGNDPEDPRSLSNSGIWTICEDRKGRLWVGTYGGLNLFDRETETFTRYRHDPNDPNSLGHDSVVAIFEDRDGILWIGTNGDGGLNRFDPETGVFTRFKHVPDDPESLSHNVIWSICGDRSGCLWIGTWGGGLNRFDRKTGKFTHHAHDPDDPESIGSNNIVTMRFDKSGILWIGTWGGGLCKFDEKTGKFASCKFDPENQDGIGSNVVRAIWEDADGNLWIGTGGGGLNKFDREKETFTRFTNNPNDPKSLSHDTVRSICEDRSGSLWTGTWNGGLSIIDRQYLANGAFAHYRVDPGNPNSLSHGSVWSMIEDRSGMIWIGTWGGGLNRFDPETVSFVHYKNDPNDPGSIGHDAVICVYEDSGGTIWAGTLTGLNRFDRDTQAFSRYRFNPKGLNLIWSIMEDRSGRLWIGANTEGLMEFDRDAETFIKYKDEPDDGPSQKIDTVLTMFEDSSGRFLVGTWEEGLKKFDRDTGKFTGHTNVPGDSSSLSRNCVRTIFEDSSGTLWIGTWGGGINKLVSFEKDASGREKASFVRYGPKQGMPNGVISGILEDDKGRLWISTFKGISIFDLKTGRFRNYDKRDGLQCDEFNLEARLKRRNGEMLFGGINGFNKFYPANIRDNPYVPPVVITDFRIFNRSVSPKTERLKNKPVLEKAVNVADSLELTHRENVFSFEFAALNYTIPEKNQYAYMMEGFDTSWFYCRDRRFVTYTNLDPGEYVFRVRGSNNDGIWNKTGTSIRIRISPPFWKTWWAYVLYTIAFAGSVAAYIRLKTRVQAKKLRIREKELEHERKLGRAREKYRRIVENAVEGIFQIKPSGRVISANPSFARILGYKSPDDLLSSSEGGADLRIRRKDTYAFFRSMSENGQVSGFEMGLKRKDGSDVLLSISARSVLDPTGGILYYEGFVLDITERREREKAERKRDAAEAANRKVMDSIRYAELIQRTLLPVPENLKNYAPESFSIWMPKDVVGGDMIYIDEFESGFVIAVIDCTGHGVPGAFMTLIASSSLKRIIGEEKCADPADALKRLNVMVRDLLHGGETQPLSHAGLDAAICFVKTNGNACSLSYAGARIPLIYCRGGKVRLIKGDRQSVGYRRRSKPDYVFAKHTLEIENPTSFYMTTDGFTDQLNEKDRRIGSKRLLKMLEENARLPFEKQRELLLKAFNEHRGNSEMQDDLTAVGFMIKGDGF